MLNNELYLATDPELASMQLRAQQLLHVFNFSPHDQLEEQKNIILSLFGKVGGNFTIRPPFYCDYECHIWAGDNLYITPNVN
ncbi:MAG: maltose acetyltransferase domain-containing protein [Cyanobacteria bacterium P01_G01_bin.39]